MNTYKIKVSDDGLPGPTLWTVKATTEKDAMQLALALDGGWGDMKNATGLLPLAEMFCCVVTPKKRRRKGDRENNKEGA